MRLTALTLFFCMMNAHLVALPLLVLALLIDINRQAKRFMAEQRRDHERHCSVHWCEPADLGMAIDEAPQSGL